MPRRLNLQKDFMIALLTLILWAGMTAWMHLAYGQKLIITGNVSGSYEAPDTILFINAYGTNVEVCAPIVIIEDSDINSTTVWTGDCQWTCDSSLTPGIIVQFDPNLGDEEWMNHGYVDVLTDSAAFFSNDAMNFYRLNIGVYVLNEIIDFACPVDSFYVSGLQITPPGGVDRPPGGTRQFDITFRALANNRTNEVVMTWIRTEDNYPMN